jgi:predicted RNase H-like HicB family nuclease
MIMTEHKVYRFPVVIEQDEDGMFVATVPALRGCHTQAKTLSELDDRVREVITLCIEAESECLGEVPQSKFIGVHELEIAV